jgi:hypothetical protein
MRKIILTIIIGCILLGLTTRANAWDGNRKGFNLGFGIGTGITSYTLTIDNTCYENM